MIAPILNFAHQPSLLVRPLRSRKMDLERCRGAKAQLAPAARRAGQPTWRCTGQPSSGKTRSLQASLQCAPRCVRCSPASQSRLAIQLTRPPEIISGTPGMSVRSAPRARRRPIERQRRLPDRQATSRQPAIGAQESQLPAAMQRADTAGKSICAAEDRRRLRASRPVFSTPNAQRKSPVARAFLTNRLSSLTAGLLRSGSCSACAFP